MSTPEDPEELLKGSPYLIDLAGKGGERYRVALRRSSKLAQTMPEIMVGLRQRAFQRVQPIYEAMRASLVAESNRIEGYDWTRTQVLEVARAHSELLRMPVHLFLRGVQQDQHLFQGLGLYRAYQIADEWAEEKKRPLEYDIRALHSLIVRGERFAGAYKSKENEIHGSEHSPTSVVDVPREMHGLCNWWRRYEGDALLGATVVHAWLAHIHPFEDGNGRLARLLANLHLVSEGYPPLTISNETDRGQYLMALARSDEGDLLPLYDLFSLAVRRHGRLLQDDGYVRQIVEDRLLATHEDVYKYWTAIKDQFVDCLAREVSAGGCEYRAMGSLAFDSFRLLQKGSKFGNGWMGQVLKEDGQPLWLLWFGYNSEQCKGRLASAYRRFPTIFFSIAEEDPGAIHPFRHVTTSMGSLPDELVVHPGEERPIYFRWGSDWEQHSPEEGARQLADALLPEG